MARKYGALPSFTGSHSGDSNALSPHSSALFKFFSLRAAVVAERYSIHVEAHPVKSNKVYIDNKIGRFFMIIKYNKKGV